MISTKILGVALLSVLSLAAPLHEEESVGVVARTALPLDAAGLELLERQLASLNVGADLYAREAFAGAMAVCS